MRQGGKCGLHATTDSDQGEVLAICFPCFAPYHIDRVVATNRLLGGHMKVFGIEYFDSSTMYAAETARNHGFERIILFPSKNREDIGTLGRLRELLSCLIRIRAKHVFLVNYNCMDTFITASFLRLMGKSPYLMIGSKFTDKNRVIWKEVLKMVLFVPYVGGITSGGWHSNYLQFLGVGIDNYRTGLDTLSVNRIRACAGSDPAPGGYEFGRRHFTIVAPMIPEKDIPTAILAYARYRELSEDRGLPVRDLVLCGDGPERGLIEGIVREKRLYSVTFLGHASEKEVCETLASTLALILPSVLETWGLVINEAVAMGVPVLCSDVCGACDELVRSGINGFSFAPGEVEGLANLMLTLGSSEEEWRRLAQGSLQVAPRADAGRFADAVLSLVQARSHIPLVRREQNDELGKGEQADAKASRPVASLAAAGASAAAPWPAVVNEPASAATTS